MAEKKELIKRQSVFIDWLKEKGIYNPMESGKTMMRMFQVWEKSQPEQQYQLIMGINTGY